MPGDAVVTGFSGTAPQHIGKTRLRGKSALDLTFIDPNGASLQIFDLAHPGAAGYGPLISAPKKFDVPAKDIGQVFGVAIDDATPPNIYVAATSVFGLNLVRRRRNGLPERRKTGGPGVGWMRGQFGLELQGGPGAIYKIDGRTGIPSLFANVTLNGVSNPAPGLGNIAYDPEHKQLFVSDLYTGMIHRFDMTGRDLGTYDHGVTGLRAARLPIVAFNPRNRPNIASERFNSEKPETWGFAPAARQVWGLAVHDGRLYYSVLAGPQIWSVGIARDGSFAHDPRWELDVPAQDGALPVSDIAFSHAGAMILAQRAPVAASYDYSAFTKTAEPKVMRFWLKGPNDPPSPGRWKPVPQEYAIGFAGSFRNTNGGVALGYGYASDGTLNTGACEATLWTSGQDLRDNPALRSRLEPGGPLVVHGLQANPADMVRPRNEPPAVSYFVDYDGKFNDPRVTGHIGSVRIYTRPCAPAAYAQRPPVVIPIVVPARCVGSNCRRVCTPTCVCPQGTALKDGKCVKIRKCPPDTVYVDGKCVKIRKCPRGTFYVDGKCLPRKRAGKPIECTPPMIPNPTGGCVCPPDSVMVNGHCVARRECKPPFVPGPIPGSCMCPHGSAKEGGTCVPNSCPAGMVPGPCYCPPGTEREGKICVVKKAQVGEIIFTKKVVYDGPIVLPPQPYPVNVTCGSNTTTLNLMPNVPQSIGNIPYGTTCTYSEPTPSTPANACPPRMVPTWTTTFAPPSPPGVNVNAPVTHVDVTNKLTCEHPKSPVDVKIEKSGGTTPACRINDYIFSLKVTNVGAAFSGNQNIVVTDTVPAGMKFTSAGGGPDWNCQTLPATAGQSITCTYIGTTGPTQGQTLPGISIDAQALDPTKFPQYTNNASVALGGGYVDTDPSNNNASATVGKPSNCKSGSPPPPPPCPQGTKRQGNKCVAVCEPPHVIDPATGVCGCPRGSYDKDGKCLPIVKRCVPPLVNDPKTGRCVRPPNCVPPSHLNLATNRCECGSGVVAGSNTSFGVGKLVEVDGVGALPDAHWGINITCTGPTNTTMNHTLWTANSLYDGTQFAVRACSACTVTEAPRPAPNVCPPGKFAIMLPPTFSPSNQVVTGVDASTVITNHIVCSPTPPTSCPSPLVLGAAGCMCPSHSTFDPATGRCVLQHMEACKNGLPRVNGKCQRLPKCPRNTKRKGMKCIPIDHVDKKKRHACPRDEIWRHNRCVKRTIRHHCPDHERWDGKRCVKRRSRHHGVAPGDVINGGINIINGIGGFGGHRGSGGSGGSGGRDTGGHRGSGGLSGNP